MKILIVVGTRPNFVKVAPLDKELKKYSKFSSILVHTGQHYGSEMSESFFNELKLPRPDIYLGVGSGTHAEQTGKIMIKFEKVCKAEQPDLIVVVGDVNSTIACTLVAVKLGIKVAHVEAGLRSFDRTMPEEINRILTDSISDYLFTTCEDANENLLKEGIDKEKIYFVGNIMIDTLLKFKKRAEKKNTFEKFDLNKKNYALLTLHRPSNVDKKASLEKILRAIKMISYKIPLIFPTHPRTKKFIKDHNLSSIINNSNSIILSKPLGYLEFLNLMINAKLVLTDSGGIQEETTVLKIPCLTLRKNTERPITVKIGTNILVGDDESKILINTEKILKNNYKNNYKIPKYWDGNTSKRVISIILNNI